ncbi:MAG: hypothetical protein ACR2OC_12200 [Solirubrobacterales bacterium]
MSDELVSQLDRRVGPRQRSGYIAAAVSAALDDESRWEMVEAALGTIDDHGHEWDDDPAAWVAAQRAADPGRVG